MYRKHVLGKKTIFGGITIGEIIEKIVTFKIPDRYRTKKFYQQLIYLSYNFIFYSSSITIVLIRNCKTVLYRSVTRRNIVC